MECGGGGARREGETQENSVTFLRHSDKAVIDIWPSPGVSAVSQCEQSAGAFPIITLRALFFSNAGEVVGLTSII